MNKIIPFLIVILGMPFFVFAQESDNVIPQETVEKIRSQKNDDSWNSQPVDTGADCFDYYSFPSVQLDVRSLRSAYNIGGEGALFSAEIINLTDQPIVNGLIFMRVGRPNSDKGDYNYIIDESIVVEGVALNPNETKAIDFNWEIPRNTAGGKYQADFFFSVGEKFNLAGLPFTNEIIADQESFEIASKNTKTISFDRSQTLLNGKKYNHVGTWPYVVPGESPVLIQTLDNFSTQEKEVEIEYELYYWDGLSSSDLIQKDVERLVIPARKKKKLEYTFPPMDESVYMLKIIASSEDDVKSIVNVRVASLKNSPRINYPAITKFPIKKGDEVTLFSCFHNTSLVNEEGHVDVRLLDGEEVVAQVEYKGPISSAMSAIKKDFVAKKQHNQLMIKASVRDGDGEIIDQYEVLYDCADFGQCSEGGALAQLQSNKDVLTIAKYILYILSGVVFVAVIAVVIIKNKK